MGNKLFLVSKGKKWQWRPNQWDCFDNTNGDNKNFNSKKGRGKGIEDSIKTSLKFMAFKI